MRPSDRDTIVAIATGHGEAAIGIVRLSGPEAVGIASGFFCGTHELNRVEDRRVTYGRMEGLVTAGARPAEPGEFTRRAFLNGRIDLTQAEALFGWSES